MLREIWDAYDKGGNKLGFDQYRDESIKWEVIGGSIFKGEIPCISWCRSSI
jgi:hypothetical protein